MVTPLVKHDGCFLEKSTKEEILSEAGAPLSPHFDAGVDGADEEDVGEHDKDGDVQAEHERRAATERREQAELGRSAHQADPS